MPIRHVRKISFVVSFLSMMRKSQEEKQYMSWGILQQLRHVYGLVFVFYRSSEMSICSSLVALMALSFSPPLMKIVCFYSTGFYQCQCNKLQGCLWFCLRVIISFIL